MDIEEIKQQAADIMAQMKESAKDNPKAQKAIAIAEQTIFIAEQLSKDLKKIAAYDKKLPRFVRKSKYSKRESKRLKLISQLNTAMQVNQLRRTIEQPIPNLTKGMLPSGGVAIVSESKEEIIVKRKSGS